MKHYTSKTQVLISTENYKTNMGTFVEAMACLQDTVKVSVTSVKGRHVVEVDTTSNHLVQRALVTFMGECEYNLEIETMSLYQNDDDAKTNRELENKLIRSIFQVLERPESN